MAVPKVVTRKEAGAALRLSRNTIDRMVKDKQLDTVKIRGSVRISAESIERVARVGTEPKRKG
jgi:excisionase family DNA binding protein